MQVYLNDNIVQAFGGEVRELADELEKDMKAGKATHGIIGKLLKKGNIIEINGLKYDVTYVDNALGKVFLKIKENS